MSKMWFLFYNCISVPLQYLIFQAARLFHKKIAVGIAGRKGQFDRLKKELSSVNQDRKKVLFHCVSVGEWEQARPVIAALKKTNSSLFIIGMFFSPSGYNYITDNSEIDLKIYMPFDSYFRARRLFRYLSPDLWVIVKHDIWPNHLYAAGNLKIPAVLIGGGLPLSSLSRFWIFRGFLRSVYRNLTYIFPISEQDKERFVSIFPYPDRMIVCGDTRYDQVYKSGMAARDGKIKPVFNKDDKKVFIAGSIWQSDEKHLIPAVVALLQRFTDLQVILVPHEPEAKHLEELEDMLSASHFSSVRYSNVSDIGTSETRVIIVDTVGILAGLYAQADITYVGGSFRPGVHNVMEPAVLGKPVLFGPRHLNSLEARQLVQNGGGYAVHNTEEIIKAITSLFENHDKRIESGECAAKLVLENRGATESIIKMLLDKFSFLSENK